MLDYHNNTTLSVGKNRKKMKFLLSSLKFYLKHQKKELKELRS